MGRCYHVYILTNKHHTVLYTGVTNNLPRRVYEHKNRLTEGFTKRYNVDKLVYCEAYEDVREAISREKQLKGGSRRKKLKLIGQLNPTWRDLYEDL